MKYHAMGRYNNKHGAKDAGKGGLDPLHYKTKIAPVALASEKFSETTYGHSCLQNKYIFLFK